MKKRDIILIGIVIIFLAGVELSMAYCVNSQVRIPALYTVDGIPTNVTALIKINYPNTTNAVTNGTMSSDVAGYFYYDYVFTAVGAYYLQVDFYNQTSNLQGTVSELFDISDNVSSTIHNLNQTTADIVQNIAEINQTTKNISPSLPFYMQIVGSTEYYPGQQGQVVIQLRDKTNVYISGATCIVDYYYPNASLWLADQAAAQLADVGVYYSSVTIPNIDGIYVAIGNCSVGSVSQVDSHTFHVSKILVEINKTVSLINQTLINTVIPYLNDINTTTSSTYTYLTDTIYPKVNDANATIYSVLEKWGTYNATELYKRINETFNRTDAIKTDTSLLLDKWGTYTAQQIFNISNVTYYQTLDIYNSMANVSALSDIQANLSWLLDNVATQANETELMNRLLIINYTINNISSNLLSINSSLQLELDSIQSNLTSIWNNLTAEQDLTDITARLAEINTTLQNEYNYLQSTVYIRLNQTWNNTNVMLSYIGTSSDAETANTLFGEHAYTQNRLAEIQSNLTYLNNLTVNINQTTSSINSTVSTILTEVDSLEEMHQCSISPNSTICSLLTLIRADTQNISSFVAQINTSVYTVNRIISSTSTFSITGLVAVSPRYASENVVVEATFSGQNGTYVVPDTLNVTIYDPNNNVWGTGSKSDFTQGNDNIWKYTKSLSGSPTTGMYSVHLQGSYMNVSNSRVVQFRVATGGPYKVYLECPTSSNVGEELNCTVRLQDEGEVPTESTSTIWVDTDNDGVADAGEPQMSFSKETVPLQNVTQNVSINVPLSHPGGLYVTRADTSYANSDQPHSGASDSVNLLSEAVTGGTGGGGGGGKGQEIIYYHVNETPKAVPYPEYFIDISVKVLDEYKVIVGNGVLAEFTLYNLGKEELKDALLSYAVKDSFGNIVMDWFSEKFLIKTKLQLIRKITLPENLVEGTYYVYGKLKYKNKVEESNSSFEFVIPKKAEIEMPARIIYSGYWWYILLLIIIIAIIIYSRKRKEELKDDKEHYWFGKTKNKARYTQLWRPILGIILLLILIFAIVFLTYNGFKLAKKEVTTQKPVKEIQEQQQIKEQEFVNSPAEYSLVKDPLFRNIVLVGFIVLMLVNLIKGIGLRGNISFGEKENKKNVFEKKDIIIHKPIGIEHKPIIKKEFKPKERNEPIFKNIIKNIRARQDDRTKTYGHTGDFDYSTVFRIKKAQIIPNKIEKPNLERNIKIENLIKTARHSHEAKPEVFSNVMPQSDISKKTKDDSIKALEAFGFVVKKCRPIAKEEYEPIIAAPKIQKDISRKRLESVYNLAKEEIIITNPVKKEIFADTKREQINSRESINRDSIISSLKEVYNE